MTTNYSLIWVDANVQNSENHSFLPKFQTIFNQIYCFSSINDYKIFIKQKQNTHDRFFLLTSGSLGKELMELVQLNNLISCAFVFCQNVAYHQTWAKEFSKVKLISNQLSELIQYLESFKKRSGYSSLKYKAAYLFDNDDQIRDYIYLNFVINLCIKKGNQQKDRAIKDLQEYAIIFIQKEEKQVEQEMKNLQKFMTIIQNPNSSDLIVFYTEETFFYRMINKTIRNGELIPIFRIRLAIFELYQQISHYKPPNSSSCPAELYRGACINLSELELWKETKQIPLMLKGFNSTTSQIIVANGFTETSYKSLQDKKSNVQVLIKIKILGTENLPISVDSISKFYGEDEYLAQLNSLLRIQNVSKQNDHYYIIETQLVQFKEIADILSEAMNSQQKQIDEILNENFAVLELYLIYVLWLMSEYTLMHEILEQIKNIPQNEAEIFEFYGHYYQGQKLYSEAKQAYLKSMNIRETTYGIEHQETATSYHNLGVIHSQIGDFDEAIRYQQKALEIRKKIYGEKHIETANSYQSFSSIYKNEGKLQEALKYSLLSLDIQKQLYGEQHISITTTYNNLAKAYLANDEIDKALEYANKSLQIRYSVYGENNLQTATCYNNISTIYFQNENYEKALYYQEKSLQIIESIFGRNHQKTKENYNNIAQIYKKLQKFDKAFFYQNLDLQSNLKIFGEINISTAISYNNLGQIYQASGNLDEGLSKFLKSLEIKKQLKMDRTPSGAQTYFNIGTIYERLKQYSLALKYMKIAEEIGIETLGLHHKNTSLYQQCVIRLELDYDY